MQCQPSGKSRGGALADVTAVQRRKNRFDGEPKRRKFVFCKPVLGWSIQ
jgi:hypothetical protein